MPAAVIVAVGAGALMMLTGRADGMLAQRAGSAALSQGKPASGPVASGQTSAGSAVPGTAASLLAGYPGQHGTEEVAALWPAGNVTVAAGSADGHPALWRHAAGGPWSLVPAPVLGGLSGRLTAVAEGPEGWIAVGSVSAGGTAQPAAFVSADGMTWQRLGTLTAAAGQGARFLGLAAGPGGYVVAGSRLSGGQPSAALWWSGDLRNWTDGMAGAPAGSVAAAAATGGGFAAAGAVNGAPVLWTSPDGQHWSARELSAPPGASSLVLTSVAAGQGEQSDRFIAAGTAVTGHGPVPAVVTAANDGTHVSQTLLASPGGPAALTAVSAAAGGFVAAGTAGTGSAQHAVAWTSREGRIWTPPAVLGVSGSSQVTALTDAVSGAPLTAAAARGAAAAVLTLPVP